MMDSESSAGEGSLPPAWQPLSAIERRIVGVLVEKAKTTPDQYPMSLNALTNEDAESYTESYWQYLEPGDEDYVQSYDPYDQLVSMPGERRTSLSSGERRATRASR